jgi:peptide-methionine (S)-S-oxide reductase
MTKNIFKYVILLLFFSSGLLTACAQNNTNLKNKKEIKMNTNLEIATFGAGCFWCVEAVFQDFKGVQKVISGYSGGEVKNPSYKEVCNGTTGHAEVAQITFDPKIISYTELLEIFWSSHNPTTLNQQGADKGTQYRSAIFYHDEKQKELAQESMKNVAPTIWEDPIVTELTAFEVFYEAENYHQNYFDQNGNAPYCQLVIAPKVYKVKEKFKNR